MLKAWEGETPKPIAETGWAPWLETATQRVMACNALLAREQNHFRGTQVKAHSKKIQLAVTIGPNKRACPWNALIITREAS